MPSIEWVRGPEAAAILACHPRALIKLTKDGRIASLRVPHALPLYSKADVERVAEESFTPAMATGAK